MLFASLIYLNLRYVLDFIPLPDPFYDPSRDLTADVVLGKHVLFSGGGGDKEGGAGSGGISDEAAALAGAEQRVRDSVEFAKRRQNKEHGVMVDEARYDTNKRHPADEGDDSDGEEVAGGANKGGGGTDADKSNKGAADGNADEDADAVAADDPTSKRRRKPPAAPELPDQVHDHTLHYPTWTHGASLHISRRTLMDKALLCQTLLELGEINSGAAAAANASSSSVGTSTAGGGRGYFSSVVIDAGWWDPRDMYAVRRDLLTPSAFALPKAASSSSSLSDAKTSRCLLCQMARACDATAEGREVSRYYSPPQMLRYAKRRGGGKGSENGAKEGEGIAGTSSKSSATSTSPFASPFRPFSLPVLLWSSALVPTTDIRYEAAALQGYFVHTGDALNPAHQRHQDEQQRRANKNKGDSTDSAVGDGNTNTTSSSSGGEDRKVILDSLLKEAKRPHTFVWRRSEVDPDGRSFHLEGSLIDWSNPNAVAFFSKDSRSIANLHSSDRPLSGFASLFESYGDVHGFRLGGVDSVLATVHHQRSRILGHKGHFSPEDYSKAYYRTFGDCGRRVTTAINTWHRKLFERGELEETFGGEEAMSGNGGVSGSNANANTPNSNGNRNRGVLLPPPTRDFVVFARAVDSHNQQHTFQSFAPPDAAAMAFSGDHELSFRDLRESALNIIHASYRCYSTIGTIIGAKHRTSIHSLGTAARRQRELQLGGSGSGGGGGGARDFVSEPKKAHLREIAEKGAPAPIIGGSSYEASDGLGQKVLALEDGLRGFTDDDGSQAAEQRQRQQQMLADVKDGATTEANANANAAVGSNKDAGASAASSAADAAARRAKQSLAPSLARLTATHAACDEAIHSALADQWFAFGSYLPGLFVPDRELHRLRGAFGSGGGSPHHAPHGHGGEAAKQKGHASAATALASSASPSSPSSSDYDPHFHHLTNGRLLSLTADHNALAPYYSANSMQSFLFDVAALHVCTSPSASFQQYQNPHGNPYCPLKYLPHFNYKLFRRRAEEEDGGGAKREEEEEDRVAVASSSAPSSSTNQKADSSSGGGRGGTCPAAYSNASALPPVIGYERNPRANRDHFPHILFDAPVDDYQFAVGPHLLAVPRLTLGATSRTISFPLLPPTMAAVAKYGHHDEDAIKAEKRRRSRQRRRRQRRSEAERQQQRAAAENGGGGGVTSIPRREVDVEVEAEPVPPPLVVGYQTPFVRYPHPHQWIDAREPYAHSPSSATRKDGTEGAPRKAGDSAANDFAEVIGADRSRRLSDGTLSFFDGIRADLAPEEVGVEGRLFLRRGAVMPLLLPPSPSSPSPSPSPAALSSLPLAGGAAPAGGAGDTGADLILVFATDAPQLSPADGFAAAAVPFTFSEWRGAVATVSLQQQQKQRNNAVAGGDDIVVAAAEEDDGKFVAFLNYTPSAHVASPAPSASESLLGSALGVGGGSAAAPVSSSSHFSVEWVAFSVTLPAYPAAPTLSGAMKATTASPKKKPSSVPTGSNHLLAPPFPFALEQRCWCDDDAVRDADGAPLEAGERVDGDDSAMHPCREVTLPNSGGVNGENGPSAAAASGSASLASRHTPLLASDALWDALHSTTASAAAAATGGEHGADGAAAAPRNGGCVVVRDASRRRRGGSAAKDADGGGGGGEGLPYQHLQLFVPADAPAKCRCI